MVAAGEKLGPRRRADRTDIEPCETGPLSGQAIESWRRQVAISILTQVTPTLIVGEDHHEIRTVSRDRMRGCQASEEHQRQNKTHRGRGTQVTQFLLSRSDNQLDPPGFSARGTRSEVLRSGTDFVAKKRGNMRAL